jgi:predicted transcriptional regulator
MPSSLTPNSASSSTCSDICWFFEQVFGDGAGTVLLAEAPNGHYTETGSYGHGGKGWHPRTFRWPQQSRQMMEFVIEFSPTSDVYVLPSLRSRSNPARKGSSLRSGFVRLELDQPDANAMRRLATILSKGSFLVRSGRPKNLHVYLTLNGLHEPLLVERASKAVANYLGGDKWVENAFLRVPATLNHKGRAQGSQSWPVTLEVPSGARKLPWTPIALIAAVGGEVRDSEEQRCRNRGAGRPVDPVEPSDVPDDLPLEIRSHLGDWTRAKDRSGHLHRLVAQLLKEGYDDDEIVAVARLDEQAQDKWPYEETLRREIQRSIEKLRIGDWVDEHVHGIRCHFREHYRSTHTQATDTKLMDALLKIAGQAHKVTFDASIRVLAEMAGISTATVPKGLSRLSDAGYLARCKPSQRKSGNAARYRVTLPQDKVDTHEHRGVGGACTHRNGEYVSTLSILDPADDVWRYKGLGCCRPTYEVLLNGPLTLEDLVTISCRSDRTITRHLKKLSIYGLTERKSNGQWVAFERPLDEVAVELGTKGVGERQSERHRLEREAYSHYLLHRERVAEKWQNELLESGYVWGQGSQSGMLLAPPSGNRWAEVAGRRWRQRHVVAEVGYTSPVSCQL